MSDNDKTENKLGADAASNSSDLLALCEMIATAAHEGQYRRDGTTPYIEHPRKVASLVGDDIDAQAAAWLHDVVEDSIIELNQLYAQKIPTKVIDAVFRLTKVASESYEAYLEGVTTSPLAIKVKVADMVANLTDSPTEKQITKYAAALQYIIS